MITTSNLKQFLSQASFNEFFWNIKYNKMKNSIELSGLADFSDTVPVLCLVQSM